jgi:hypothetical protein
MVTILFKCPKCQVCCISSLTLMDDVFALASDIPVRRQCWNCGAESLVVQKSGTRPIPHDGRWDLSYEGFLQAAAACRLRATDAKHPALRKLFLRMEGLGFALAWSAAASKSLRPGRRACGCTRNRNK